MPIVLVGTDVCENGRYCYGEDEGVEIMLSEPEIDSVLAMDWS